MSERGSNYNVNICLVVNMVEIYCKKSCDKKVLTVQLSNPATCTVL